MVRILSLISVLLMNVACVPEPEDTCGAAAYEPFIGTFVDDLPSGLLDREDMRIIGPNTPITKDLRPNRVNLMVDEEGTITEVRCF